MTTITPQTFINITVHKTPRTSLYAPKSRKPTNSFTRIHVNCHHPQGFRMGKDLVFNEKITKKKRVVLVRFNNLKFTGGGGGRDDDNNARVLGNLALAIGLTYLTLTGQLGWILDTIVSIWLLVILVPVVGFGALIWWAARDMVQSNCPNCGNEFEVFKSMLNDGPQPCPYCSQPFSVVGDEFVRNPVKFSNESTTFGEAFNDLSSRPKKGKASSRAVIDIEAEVKDVD